MNQKFLIAFLALATIQWAIPARIIIKKNEVLEKGQSFKFQTEPVDPSNPFKGKYITLNFTENSFTDTGQNHFGDEEVFVSVSTGPGGYAVVNAVSTMEPGGHTSYVKAKIYSTSRRDDSTTIFLDYPFDEFYMDEFKAPQAENIYRDSNRNSSNKTYALVKIWKGQAVIEDVLINGIPIRNLIK